MSWYWLLLLIPLGIIVTQLYCLKDDIKKDASRVLNNIKLLVLNKILSDSDKYLLSRAIDDRINTLSQISINETWADKEQIHQDISKYKKLKLDVPSEDWN